MERRSKSKALSGPHRTRSPRSLSPNNVLIDGLIIDKEPPTNLTGFRKGLLENIVEETDPLLQDLEFPIEEKYHSAPLEEAVKKADENVQKFIKEISENNDNGSNCKNIEPICKRSEEELRELSKFLAIMDDTSKNKIVDTLINVYKREILSCVQNIPSPHSLHDPTLKCKDDCQGLIPKNPEAKQVRFMDAPQSGYSQSLPVVDKLEQQTVEPDLHIRKNFENNIPKVVLPSTYPRRDVTFSTNEEIPKPENIKTSYSHISLNYSQVQQNILPDRNNYLGCKQLISESIQANVSSLENLQIKGHPIDYLKPYNWRNGNCFDSRSDIEAYPLLGCQLKPIKSKSDTELNRLKHRKKRQRKQKESKRNKGKKPSDIKTKRSDVVQVERKFSRELPDTKQLKQNQLINYLDQELKTGNSSHQFSQVLFETAHKLAENDLSSLEIPYVDPIQFGSFNPNYLLHSLKIACQSKTDLLPKIPLDYFTTSGSDFNISEDEYRKWLKKRNWTKYSFLNNNMPSIDNLYSISQTMIRELKKDTFGEYGYYLDKEDVPPRLSFSESKSFIEDFAETFLYEHVVISKAMNFFLTFNAKRTRVLSKWDRCVQVFFFGLFYSLWVIFNTYILMDPKSKKGTVLWK